MRERCTDPRSPPLRRSARSAGSKMHRRRVTRESCRSLARHTARVRDKYARESRHGQRRRRRPDTRRPNGPRQHIAPQKTRSPSCIQVLDAFPRFPLTHPPTVRCHARYGYLERSFGSTCLARRWINSPIRSGAIDSSRWPSSLTFTYSRSDHLIHGCVCMPVGAIGRVEASEQRAETCSLADGFHRAAGSNRAFAFLIDSECPLRAARG